MNNKEWIEYYRFHPSDAFIKYVEEFKAKDERLAAADELAAALNNVYGACCPQGHLNDKAGMWADARTALSKWRAEKAG